MEFDDLEPPDSIHDDLKGEGSNTSKPENGKVPPPSKKRRTRRETPLNAQQFRLASLLDHDVGSVLLIIL